MGADLRGRQVVLKRFPLVRVTDHLADSLHRAFKQHGRPPGAVVWFLGGTSGMTLPGQTMRDGQREPSALLFDYGGFRSQLVALFPKSGVEGERRMR
jgi:hypothetical protein